MKQKSKPTLTLDLTEDEKLRLRLLAQQLGLYIGRGSMADYGSIQKLISGIANGHFSIIKPLSVSSNVMNRDICFMPATTSGENFSNE